MVGIARLAKVTIPLLLLIAGLLVISHHSAAQGPLTITGQSVTCSSIQVTYQILGEFAPQASIVAFANGNTYLNAVNGPASPPGVHSATVSFDTQPDGTMLHARVSVGEFTVDGPQAPCGGAGESEGSGGGEAGGSSEPADPPSSWPGYSDGRLNPAPDEYYSVWCKSDQVEVWRALPDPLLLVTFSLAQALDLSEGGSLESSGITLVRQTFDTMTLSGSNGNGAPNPGSKSFSLSECIARNGRVPESLGVGGDAGGAENPIPPQPSPCEDEAFLRENLEACLLDAGFNNVGVAFIQLFFLCVNGILPLGLVVVAAGLNRRRRLVRRD